MQSCSRRREIVVSIVGDVGGIWNFVVEVVKLVYQIDGTSLGFVAQVFRSFDEWIREGGHDVYGNCAYGNGADDDRCVGEDGGKIEFVHDEI